MDTIFNLNGKPFATQLDKATPLLWVLRENQEHEVKFGCGAGLCGACTVIINGEATRSCQVPLGEVAGKKITTITGLSGDAVAEEVFAAWEKYQVPQCGYCQPGLITAVVAEMKKNPTQSAKTLLSKITNICRCGTYEAVRNAVNYLQANRT